MRIDYYRTLGVDQGASQAEIKKAFRRLARDTHPDSNPGDPTAEARFREAAEAYQVLSDPEKRSRYDRGETADFGDLLSGFGGIDDILRSVFGDSGLFGGRAPRTRRGRDILVHAEVSLEQAAFGGETTVSFRSRVACADCSGSGAEAGTDRTTCPDCGGAGQVRVTQRSIFGSVLTATTCPRCQGIGSWVPSPCQACGGAGVVADTVEVNVEVPAGISPGTRLRMSGRGESAGGQGTSGDLYLELSIADHPVFERHENDLWYSLPLGMAEATLGTRVKIPTIDGDETSLEVPRGTQPGDVFRIGGAGMTVLGRKVRGDLLVVARVEIPTELNQEEEDLMRRWSELRSENTDRPAATP